MATLDQLERALVNADAAGDTAAATQLAQAIKGMRESAKPQTVDPTEGMSTTERFLAGIGRGMSATTRAALQGLSKMVGADAAGASLVKQSDIDEAKRLDAPLMNTTAGKLGNLTGSVAMAAPTALIPGANTYTGAALIGGGLGGLTTEGGLDERLKGAAFGAAGGVAGKGFGDILGAGAQWLKNQAVQQSAQRAIDPKLIAAREAQRAGFTIPPADIPGTGATTNLLSALSGKIKTSQVASARNQPLIDAAARREAGLAADAAITPESLQAVRNAAAENGYAPIRSAGAIPTDKTYAAALDSIASQYQGAARSFPGAAKNPVVDMVDGLRVGKFDAGDAIDMTKVLRESADQAYRAGNAQLGKAAKAAADAIEGQLDRFLTANGSADAVKAFREARTQIAKTYSVQKALENGGVSAAKLVQQLQKGKPLSGELRTVAEVAQQFPKATQSLKEAPGALSPLDMAVAFGMGDITGLAARPAARSLLLSQPFQRAAMNPSGPSLLSMGPAAVMDQELLRRALPGLLAMQATNE